MLIPACLIAIILGTSVFGDPARELLRFERLALLDGELWRLLSAHLVHLGAVHMAMNLLALILLLWLFQTEIRAWAWVSVGITCAAAISLGLLLLSPATQWYVGLSGVLHGWFAFGAARVCHKDRLFGAMMLACLVAKIAWEQFAGTLPLTAALDIGPVVVDAHLYGAVGGGLYYVIWRTRTLVAGSDAPL